MGKTLLHPVGDPLANVYMQTLINEMRLEPFNKANCIAMLNTLYPPTTAQPPTRQLSPAILASQRSAFFRYITAVEKNGKGILSNLENQGQRKGDANGWSVVREIVDKYLRTTNGVIEEYIDVSGAEYFEAQAEAFRRSERRADSGVSFATGDRPSTSGSTSSKTIIATVAPPANKPLPKSPPKAQAQTQAPAPPLLKKRGTTLERIAREWKNLRTRNDVKEMPLRSDQNIETKGAKSQGLRKMKSTSSIRDRKTSHSRTNSDEHMPDFDFDAKRRRMINEARKEKENRVPMEEQKMVGRSFHFDV